MQSRLLSSIHRSLTWRARANAASAVRKNAQHAAQRHEAAQAMIVQRATADLRR